VRVLITHRSLENRAGSEVFVRDVAGGLRARDHSPVVYSPILGEIGAEIRRLTVPVIDDLAKISTPPDVIHGHHEIETMAALLRFPNVPAVYFCQDWFRAVDRPPVFPRVRRYAVVDETCRDKLEFEHAVPPERIRMIPGFVDLSRFRERESLPAQPRRALIYSSYARNNDYLRAIESACASAGIQLDVIGSGVGRTTEAPEDLLSQYDIVFAKGRSALEAVATGAAVILYVMRHAGPLVTTTNLDSLIMQNFGIRAMLTPLTPEEVRAVVSKQLQAYAPADAKQVAGRVRTRLNQDLVLTEIVSLYEEAVLEQKEVGSDLAEEGVAAADFVTELAGRLYSSAPETIMARISRTPLVGAIGRRIYRAYRYFRPPVWWQRPSR
jgi:glycosyl transferase family 4